MKLVIKKFVRELRLDKIDLSKDNVRITGAKKGLEGLKESIKKFGLFQPVTVFAKGNRYNLLVGQRRYHAFNELGKTTIPAFIITPLDSTTRTIVSFGENVLRKKIPYDDGIEVCNKLFREYHGGKKEKIEKIAKDIGLSNFQVSKYLAHKLVPTEVRNLVSAGKLTETLAYRITSTYYPNTEKILAIARNAFKMTKAESQRALEYSKNHPRASVNEILKYAKNPPPFIKLIIHVELETNKRIIETAKQRRQSIVTFIKDAIMRSLNEED